MNDFEFVTIHRLHDQDDFQDFFLGFLKENFAFQPKQWIWVSAVCEVSLDTFRRHWWSKMEVVHTPFHMLQHQDTTNQYFEYKVFSTISLVQDTKNFSSAWNFEISWEGFPEWLGCDRDKPRVRRCIPIQKWPNHIFTLRNGLFRCWELPCDLKSI